MASLYEKERSPFWYIHYRDPKSGKWMNRSTGLRRDSAEETQKARKLRADWESKERSIPRVQTGEQWSEWVPAWLKQKYSESPLTLERSETAWKALSVYFREMGIRSARILTRGHCLAYRGWRTGDAGHEAGLRRVKHNTAVLELKVLSAIMREAVERGMTGANPVAQLGVKRARGVVKPEMTDDEIQQIEAALEAEKNRPHNEAMQIAWQIALLQVCRLKETCVPMADVDLVEGTITFRVKGGRDHSAMLHPDLVPLFERLRKTGRELAYEMPANFAKMWWNFFRRHKLGHLCFHSTRVTGVTRLRRGGVDLRVAMDYVGHSSVIVHRIYDRQRRAEQSAATAALSRLRPPSPPATGSCTPSSETPDAPPAT